MKKTIWTIIFILFIAATLCACSNEGFPTGTYRHNQYVLEYKENGSFTLLENGEIVTEGTYSVQDDEITWIQDSFCDEQNAGSATYKWSADDDGLSLELMGEDLCEARHDTCSLKWFGPN